MKASDLDFPLSESLIADRPVEPRDHCRLLVLHKDGMIEDRYFFDLPDYMERGDILLLNDTRVFPARLTAKKKTGGKVELLLVREIGPLTWEILCRDNYTGSLILSDGSPVHLREGKIAVFEYDGDIIEHLWKIGEMPLPPYIKRRPSERDKEWYQTVFAEKTGSIAAPTAGIHFTPDLIERIRTKGVSVMFITLHVGVGTFRPVRSDNVEDHRMEPEYFEIRKEVLKAIEEAKTSGKKVFSVGTTTTRAVEGLYNKIASVKSNGLSRENGSFRGSTDIFIYPGYRFNVIDALITNFHLPRSTPLFLAAAFVGREKLIDAYRHAISMEYRFFSYGDAMLIV
jgi:S-adenosylmethionine:tRNA ribosyltransferase-isomerase